jgi:DNA-binding transcriptional regulator PaaX
VQDLFYVGYISHDWKEIDRQALKNAIKSLYQSKLVEVIDQENGSKTLILTEEGKHKALTFKLEKMQVKPSVNWDGVWRIIISDIPEGQKKKREDLRLTLWRLGFYKLQKSVYVIPHECKDEIEFVIECYDLRKYVRQILAHSIDNEFHLRQIFKLPEPKQSK